MMWVASLKEKTGAFENFKLFKNRVENESGVKMKCLRLDRGREFTSRDFNMFCEEDIIKRQLSSPKTLEKNGIAKRRNKSVAETTRAMLYKNDVSKTFWIEVNTVVYTLNKVKIKKGMRKTPYELWFDHSPSVKYFRIFGSVT